MGRMFFSFHQQRLTNHDLIVRLHTNLSFLSPKLYALVKCSTSTLKTRNSAAKLRMLLSDTVRTGRPQGIAPTMDQLACAGVRIIVEYGPLISFLRRPSASEEHPGQLHNFFHSPAKSSLDAVNCCPL